MRAPGNFRTKQQLAAQVFTELELHAHLEESVFYPAYAAMTGQGIVDFKTPHSPHQVPIP
jgi:hypothetical protein